MRKNFNPYNNSQKTQSFSQPQYRVPTLKDFTKLFTKLDLFAVFLILITDCFNNDFIGGVLIKSFASSIIFMPKFILLMRKLQKHGQPIRADGPQSHLIKKNTPTMGGLFIVVFSVILSMIYCNTHMVYIPILSLIFYGILGFYDDFLKIKKNNSKGLKPKQKLIVQIGMAAFFTFSIYAQNPDITKIYLPFFGLLDITVWFFLPLGTATIISASNAFNLTDGLDSLAITQFFVIATFFVCVALGLTHHADFINSFFYNKEIAKFLMVTIGVGGSFLWFNSFPAKIFMGDVGSLALGAMLGVISLLFALPLVLIISGIVMVAETISVIIQVYYFRKTKGQRRFFLMAPLHHHFEKLGIHENQITQAMLIVSIIFNLIASQI
jgi:phospho-N-acetylmuramoyl-pentapeptide-transferase